MGEGFTKPDREWAAQDHTYQRLFTIHREIEILLSSFRIRDRRLRIREEEGAAPIAEPVFSREEKAHIEQEIKEIERSITVKEMIEFLNRGMR